MFQKCLCKAMVIHREMGANFKAAHKAQRFYRWADHLAHDTEAANISCSQITAAFNLKTNWHLMRYKPKLHEGCQATTSLVK